MFENKTFASKQCPDQDPLHRILRGPQDTNHQKRAKRNVPEIQVVIDRDEIEVQAEKDAETRKNPVGVVPDQEKIEIAPDQEKIEIVPDRDQETLEIIEEEEILRQDLLPLCLKKAQKLF